MRPVLYGDIRHVVSVLLAERSRNWRPHLRELIERAEAADRYRKRFGRWHRPWGNGSLGASAASPQGLRRDMEWGDERFCACLSVVLDELSFWRAEKAAINRPRKRRS